MPGTSLIASSILLIGLLATPAVLAETPADCIKQTLRQEFEDNPQLRIWHLAESGRKPEAEDLQAKLADLLQNGRIIGNKPLGIGKSNARLITLEGGTQAIWKRAQQFPANGAYELAAYAMDQKLEAHLVPLVVERTMGSTPGTMHLFVKDKDPLELKRDPKSLILFDDLIGNVDRHGDNYFTVGGRQVAIDHGVSFKFSRIDFVTELKETTDEFRNFRKSIKLVSDELVRARSAGESPERIKALEDRIPYLQSKERDFFVKSVNRISAMMIRPGVYERLKATSEDEWQKTLSTYLGPGELRIFLDKRKRIIESVEEAKATFGEENIFPAGSFSPLLGARRQSTKPR